MTNIKKLLKVIKYTKGLFALWLLFTLFFSALGIFVDVFIAKNNSTMWSEQIKNEVFYVVAISLIAAYIADSLSLLQIDGEFLGKKTDKKEYFFSEKIFVTAIGIVLIILILLAYIEGSYNGWFQILYLFLTLMLGIFLYTLRHFDHVEVKIEHESIEDAEEIADDEVQLDVGKVK